MGWKKLHSGKFRPKNISKYKGNSTEIFYRSGWELRFMSYLDKTPSVLKWSSEEIVVPYKSPIDKRIHRYFPDFWIKIKKENGLTECVLIEVKPKKGKGSFKRKKK